MRSILVIFLATISFFCAGAFLYGLGTGVWRLTLELFSMGWNSGAVLLFSGFVGIGAYGLADWIAEGAEQ